MMKQRALILGLVSAAVAACGVAMALLLHFVVLTIIDQYKESISSRFDDDNDNNMEVLSVVRDNNNFWSIGLVYIIPGAFGLIAAFVQNKCLYVTSCVLSLISLILMGLLVFFGGYVLILLILGFGNISEQCSDTIDGCTCRDDYGGETRQTAFKDCDGLATVASQIIALLAVVIIAWIFLLFECVMSCYYACRPGSSSQGVVMYTPAQDPMMPPPSKPGMSQYPPPGYAGAPQQMYYDDTR